jgi:hypothetical protein
MNINLNYRERRNVNLRDLDKSSSSRNIQMPVNDLHRFQANVNKSCQNKKPFGRTLMNRCKSKNLNMFIETASKMVRGISAQRDISRRSSVRTYNNSVKKRNSVITDASG